MDDGVVVTLGTIGEELDDTIADANNADVEAGEHDVEQCEAAEQIADPSAKRRRVNYECEPCGRQYSDKRSLVRHERTPAHCRRAGKQEPDLGCYYCGKRYSRNDILQRHIQEVHLGLKRTESASNSSVGKQSASGENQLSFLRTADPASLERAPDNIEKPTFQLAGHEPFHAIGLGELDDSDTQYLIPAGGPERLDRIATVRIDEVDSESIDYEQLSRSGSPSSVWDSVIDSSTQRTLMESPNTFSTHSGGLDTDCQQASSASSADLLQPFADTVVQDMDGASVVTTASSLRRLQGLPFRLLRRSSLTRKGGTGRPGSDIPLPPCALCKTSVGTTIQELRAHLAKHSSDFTKPMYTCNECDIDIFHEEDLHMHERSSKAVESDCGFQFVHQDECKGHHPPMEFSEFLTDHDRASICNLLRKWEQLELKTYIFQIEDAIQQAREREQDCWSFAGFQKSLDSIMTVRSTIAGFSSPDHKGYQTRFRTPGRVRARGAVANSIRKAGLRAASLVSRGTYRDPKLLSQSLFRAVQAKDLAGAKRIVAAGVQIDLDRSFQPDGSFFQYGVDESQLSTSLLTAVENEDLDMVNFLLDSGANPNAKWSPVRAAARTGNIDWSPVRAAARTGNIDVARALLTYGANVNLYQDCRSSPPVNVAAREGHYNMVALLAEQGADLDVSWTGYHAGALFTTAE